MRRLTVRRRGFLAAAAGGAALVATPCVGGARAQATALAGRTARMIVGYPPGGPTDTVARLLAERLRGAYAQQVVVENRPGAAGRLGVEAAKAAPPDGATMLMTPATVMTIFPHVYGAALRYDPLADFAPVSPVCASPYAFVVRADHPAADLAGFAAWARRQPAEVPYASPAAGAGPHFVGVRMARDLGLSMTHVPYRGTAPALQDLLAGQVPGLVVQVGNASELHRARQVRILAVSSAERLPSLPDVPTFAEAGLADMTGEEWFGVLLPARAPVAVVEALHAAVLAAAGNAEFGEALARQEFRAFTLPPAEFAALIRRERDAWGPVVAASGFRPED